jgi:hypothetical protein
VRRNTSNTNNTPIWVCLQCSTGKDIRRHVETPIWAFRRVWQEGISSNTKNTPFWACLQCLTGNGNQDTSKRPYGRFYVSGGRKTSNIENTPKRACPWRSTGNGIKRHIETPIRAFLRVWWEENKSNIKNTPKRACPWCSTGNGIKRHVETPVRAFLRVWWGENTLNTKNTPYWACLWCSMCLMKENMPNVSKAHPYGVFAYVQQEGEETEGGLLEVVVVSVVASRHTVVLCVVLCSLEKF